MFASAGEIGEAHPGGPGHFWQHCACVTCRAVLEVQTIVNAALVRIGLCAQPCMHISYPLENITSLVYSFFILDSLFFSLCLSLLLIALRPALLLLRKKCGQVCVIAALTLLAASLACFQDCVRVTADC